MKIPAAFAPKSWEMPPGFRVLEESASVVTREFDGEKLDCSQLYLKREN